MNRIASTALFLLALSAPAWAQARDRWRLEWRNEKPEMFIHRTADNQIVPYWFVLFEVSNPSNETIPLILDVVLYVEAGKDLMSDVRKVDSETIKDELASDKFDVLHLKNGTKVYGLVSFKDDKYYVVAARESREIPGNEVIRWIKRSGEVRELLKYGRFHPSIIHPEVEYKIIEHATGLGNRSPGIVQESIEAFKKGFDRNPDDDLLILKTKERVVGRVKFADGKYTVFTGKETKEYAAADVESWVQGTDEKVYLLKDFWLRGRWKKGDRLFLNPREIREQKFIRPGQRIGGVAIFKGVNPNAQVLELQISGLVDIIKLEPYVKKDLEENPELALPQIAYENLVLKIRYEFKGDEHERAQDIVVFKSRGWVIKRLGPIADKETIQNLVDRMVESLRHEQNWIEWRESGAVNDAEELWAAAKRTRSVRYRVSENEEKKTRTAVWESQLVEEYLAFVREKLGDKAKELLETESTAKVPEKDQDWTARIVDAAEKQLRDILFKPAPVSDADALKALEEKRRAVLYRFRANVYRARDGVGPNDLRITVRSIQLATGKDFGYRPLEGEDAAKDPERLGEIVANAPAIWRIHEWWVTNKAKLVYNEVTNRYEVSDEKLPGTVIPKDK